MRYSLAIQAMLQLPNEHHPLEAAMILRQDAVHMGVRLPVKVQLQLLNKSLEVGSTYKTMTIIVLIGHEVNL